MTPKTDPYKKKEYKANTIPEEAQINMRRRLRLARESLGLHLSDVKAVGPGTLGHYERRDISTLRLGDLREIALRFGWSFSQMMTYLVGTEDMETTTESKNISRVQSYMRSMSPEMQIAACDILRVLSNHKEDNASA